ncbi:Baseplate hub assembly protein, bacteriophage T4-like [uncultured Caudovirales phage]|uniref:Baseplate hub assembly protein, bacteriophage T4-like n=1 Tax=uncultured Caudovirales phage TaxID=2100421 RepID=A0A6J5KPA4_9CAUD|nr:Baseplate hub assembly protein, bacteriophage T4-like [uncultured Caudovirales phage]
MRLPKLEYPVHEVKLLSRDKPIRFRPFLVKEQKILMMAVESKNLDTVVDSMKQIINNCVVDEIDVDTLSLIDIEMFFLNLRARSIGEVIDVFFKCKNIVDDVECNMVINVGVDLLKDVEVTNNTQSNKVMFNDKVGVIMKYPSLNHIKILDEEKNISDKMIIDCMDQIFDEDEVYLTKDATEEELIEFLDKLSSQDLDKLETFIKNSPKISYNKNHNCPKCNFEHNISLEGLGDFFI